MPGYEPPSFITELHVHLEDCGVEYRSGTHTIAHRTNYLTSINTWWVHVASITIFPEMLVPKVVRERLRK